MGKKLAIRGHATRGKEVIELLQMMGGENTLIVSGYKLSGYEPFNLYYINDNGVINYKYHSLDKDMVIFTLEEFLEKYPYKVGDKIPDVWGNSCTVKSMSWDENYKTVMYGFEETIFVVRGDELYMTNIINNHTEPYKMKNVLAELLEHIKTTPKEDLEKEFEELEEWSDVGPTVEAFRTFCECVNKQPTYPTTYKECCERVNACPTVCVSYDSNEDMLYNDEVDLTLLALRKLRICRDAYWKIAGEEMGLGKPWKPNEASINAQYGIRPLLFPSKEIYNIFYDNFKDLIEQCKSLL